MTCLSRLSFGNGLEKSCWAWSYEPHYIIGQLKVKMPFCYLHDQYKIYGFHFKLNIYGFKVFSSKMVLYASLCQWFQPVKMFDSATNLVEILLDFDLWLTLHVSGIWWTDSAATIRKLFPWYVISPFICDLRIMCIVWVPCVLEIILYELHYLQDIYF